MPKMKKYCGNAPTAVISIMERKHWRLVRYVTTQKPTSSLKPKIIKPKGIRMRRISVNQITDAIARLAQETNYFLGEDVCQRIAAQKDSETSELARDILSMIQQNTIIAGEEGIPLCQDTGVACVFLEIGQDVHLDGGDLTDAVNQGVRKGYQEGFLRKSMVADPLRRVNTGDNTPAALHVDIVPGNQVKIIFAPKGFGSENMSRVAMLAPSQGRQGVIDFVLENCEACRRKPVSSNYCGRWHRRNLRPSDLVGETCLAETIESDQPGSLLSGIGRTITE